MLDITAVGADHDIKFSRLANVLQVLVIELEQVGVDDEVDGAAFAWLEADALKALELLNRTGNAAYHVTDVELDYLGALYCTRIGNGDRCGDVAVCSH